MRMDLLPRRHLAVARIDFERQFSEAAMSRWFSYFAAITVIGLMHAPAKSQPTPDAIAARAMPRTTSCPAERQTVDIKASSDPKVSRQQRDQLKDALARDGTTVRLG